MGKLLASTGLLFLACAQTPYDRCRTAAAFNQDPVARQIELGNCEQIANREAAQQMHAEAMAVEKERTERLAPPPAQTAEPPLKQPYPEPTTPSRCVIWTPNDPTAPTAFLTKPDAVADLQAARQAGVSAEDRLRLFERSGGLWVEPGTKCRFIEVLPSGVAKVRLLEGVHAGVDGWIFLPRTQASAGQ